MKSLRSKFILIFMLMTILPAIPVALVAHYFFNKSLGIALQEPLGRGLSSALELVTMQMNVERGRLAAQLRAVAEKIPESETPPWHRGEGEIMAGDLQPDSGITLAIVDSSGLVLRQWPAGATLRFESSTLSNARPSDSLLNVGSDSVAVRLALRLAEARWLIGEQPVAPSLRQHSGAIVAAAQMNQYLDLRKSELQQSLLLAFLAVYVPMLGISLAAGWYLSRRITAPLAELSAGVQKLTEGHWHHRVAIRSHDEIGHLGRAFNLMVTNLRQQQEQVIALEKMAAWREIARVLAHEIKNPLTPMQLMVRQIQDEYHGEDVGYRQTLSECCTIIDEEIEKLRQLVREFSDFARMPELNPAPAQLNELVTEVARFYSKQARVQPPQLDPDLPVFRFDWDAIRRVLINLVENAVQASPAGEVTIRTRYFCDEQLIVLSVEDTGPGIASENLSRIFEPYFSTKKYGVGLGLAIVKRIVEEHNGDISVDSEVGRGTTFSCEFRRREIQRTER